MDSKSWGILLALGAGVAWVMSKQADTPGGESSDSAVSFVDDPFASISDMVVASTAGWKNVKDGPLWVPFLNAAEETFGIPTDLLARIAYQESRFRPEIIDGTKASSAGALGLMQLMPQYFPSVRVPRPFTTQDTQNQLEEAAQLLSTNYASLGTWPQAVAAYNAGLTTVKTGNASAANKAATASYVASILADLPGLA